MDEEKPTAAGSSRPHLLPPPVVSFSGGPPKRPRIKRAWSAARKRMLVPGGTQPNSSLGEPTTETSSSASSLRNVRTADGESGAAAAAAARAGWVDEVVVEQYVEPEEWAKAGGLVGAAGSDQAGTGTGMPGTKVSEDASSYKERDVGGKLGPVGRFCMGTAWPKVHHFFSPHYHDAATEEAYIKEWWWTSKRAHLYGSLYFVLNWALQTGLVARPWTIWLDVSNYGLGPTFCLPLVGMVAFDWPRSESRWRRSTYQIWLWMAVWYSSMTNIIDIRACGYYIGGASNGQCGGRDFISVFLYAAAPPAIALFLLGQSRLAALGGMLIWLAIVCGTVVASKVNFVRNLINLAIFYAFLLIASYQRDINDRKLYTMRSELKVQYRAKQRAEINERKSTDSKRRFSNYVFHEVRGPLNTALLAVQNLEANNVFDRHGEQAVEYAALEGSLQMMSQVLNDVLDFNRMERGGFSSVSLPFSLHNVMRSIFSRVEVEATARSLSLETSLDPKIDEVAKRAALGTSAEGVVSEGEGLVMGDEMRLRQVITNLTTNATKFTRPGGKVSIKSELIYSSKHAPESPVDTAVGDDSTVRAESPTSPRLSHGRLQRHNSVSGTSVKATSFTNGRRASHTPSEVIVVRFEVTDTGVGIDAGEMQENRLFSPYIQTMAGKEQGGKGTGLGLSLVRQIVTLSGGRLGVKSKVGEGSTFWFELPFHVGPQTIEHGGHEGHRRVSSSILPPASIPERRRTSSFGLASTPGSINSDSATEYNFKPPPLAQRKSDFSLSKIDERHVTIEMLPSPSSSMGSSSPPLLAPTSPASSFGLALRSPPVPSPKMPGPPPPSPAARSPLLSPAATPPLSPPILPPATSSTSSVASKVLPFQNGPLEVLVVDDDSLTRKLMGRLLSRLGCVVDVAENGAVAVEKVLARTGGEAYGIVFMDNQMPVMSGLTAVRKLREAGREDLIVGATANALLADQGEFISCGADHVLTKPVMEADLRRLCLLADERRGRQSPAPSPSPSPSPSPTPPPPILTISPSSSIDLSSTLPQSPAQAYLGDDHHPLAASPSA